MKLGVIQYFNYEQVRLDLYSRAYRLSNESVFIVLLSTYLCQ